MCRGNRSESAWLRGSWHFPSIYVFFERVCLEDQCGLGNWNVGCWMWNLFRIPCSLFLHAHCHLPIVLFPRRSSTAIPDGAYRPPWSTALRYANGFAASLCNDSHARKNRSPYISRSSSILCISDRDRHISGLSLRMRNSSRSVSTLTDSCARYPSQSALPYPGAPLAESSPRAGWSCLFFSDIDWILDCRVCFVELGFWIIVGRCSPQKPIVVPMDPPNCIRCVQPECSFT